MKERPILFSGAMIRAILAGHKTQTRRIVKPQPDHRTTRVSICRDQWMGNGPSGNGVGTAQWDHWRKSPFAVGDRLWVREAWRLPSIFNAPTCCFFAHDLALHAADGRNNAASRHQNTMLMPRWASRILLEIVSVRVERLQDISEADAKAEGICRTGVTLDCGLYPNYADPTEKTGYVRADDSYMSLWEQINGNGSWAANPWVWVVEFRRVEE